jgi:hypothetical protein
LLSTTGLISGDPKIQEHTATALHGIANKVNITLPPFWADNAAGWFAHVEFRFRAKKIFEEWDRFDFAVAALSKEVIQLCFAAVAHPDEDEPYTRLKEDLLQQHSRTK